jgi:hypothetical protein
MGKMKSILDTLTEKMKAGENPDIVGDLIEHARMLEDCVGAVDAAITDLYDDALDTHLACGKAGDYWRADFVRGFADKLADISKLLEKEPDA